MNNFKADTLVDGTSALRMDSCGEVTPTAHIIEFPSIREHNCQELTNNHSDDTGEDALYDDTKDIHRKQIESAIGIAVGTIIAFAALLF